jgi:hypothetical protein
MGSRVAGLMLASAAALFWLAWVLMPGVGVTDPAQIFQLVSSQRSLVATSVGLQLASAVLYVPALLGLLAAMPVVRGVRLGAGFLLVGAMGSAADAVLHLLAYAMTMPDLDPATLIRVMAFMQGPGLVLLAPLLLSFFIGGAVLSIAFARAGIVSKWNPWLDLAALVVAVAGGALASSGVVPARAVGLTVLGLFAAPQVHCGVALLRARYEPRAASRAA